MDSTPAYCISRAHITSDVLSAAEAARLFATRECQGSVENGFTFWSEFEGLRLVRCLVTPIALPVGH